jgi:hypothetical protein
MTLSTALDGLVHGARRFTSLRFFSRREPLRTAWQVIGWWEARRVPYNLIVGATGLATGTIMLITGFVVEIFLGEPVGIPDPPLVVIFALVFYAIMANICFTGGWVIELAVHRIWGEQAQSFGPISFTLGLLFSIALTIAPVFLVVGVVLLRMGLQMFGIAWR